MNRHPVLASSFPALTRMLIFLASCTNMVHVSNSRMSLRGFKSPGASAAMSVKGAPSFPHHS